jgi:hypothetical protein
MIDILLEDFIREIKTDQALLHETAFAAVIGDHERYFQRKFAYSIRNNPGVAKDDTVANESYNQVDLVFFQRKQQIVHFVEMKSMPFPLRNQDKDEFNTKNTSAKVKVQRTGRKLLKDKSNKYTCQGWILFVYTDFNQTFIDQFAPDYPKKFRDRIKSFEWNGIFQNQYKFQASESFSKLNQKNVLGKKQLNWINLPLSNCFSGDCELRIAFDLIKITLHPLTHPPKSPQQII